MKGLSFDGVTFASLNVAAQIEPSQASAPRRPLAVDRTSSTPLYAGISQGVRIFSVTFTPKPTYNTQTTLLTLLGHLSPDTPEPRTFVAELQDGTDISCLAAVGSYRFVNTNQLIVDFYTADPIWRELTPTIISATGITTTTQIPLVNDGGAVAWPTVKVGWSSNRASEAPTVGWKYKLSLIHI